MKKRLKESELFKGEKLTYFQHVDGCCNVKGDLLFELYRYRKFVVFHCYEESNLGIQKKVFQ